MRIRFVIMLLAVCVLAGPALAEPAIPPLADKLPSDTLIYIGWGGYEANAEALKGTNLGKMLTADEVKAFITKTVAELERGGLALAGGGQEAKIYRAVRKLAERMWHRPWAAGLVRFDPPAGGEQPAPRLELALLIEGGEQAAGVSADLDALMDLLVPADARANGKRIQIGTQIFQQIQVDEGVPPLSWGRAGNLVLLTVGADLPARLGRVLAGAEQSLAAGPRFLAASAKVSGGGVLNSYIDADALVNKTLPQWAGAMGHDGNLVVQVIRESLGLGSIDSIASSLTTDGGDLVNRGWVATPRGKPGLLALADQKPLPRQLLQIAPADSTFFYAGNLNLSQAHTEFEKQLQKYPEPWGEYSEGLAQLEQMLGFRIRGDLLDALGDGFVVYNSPRAGGFVISGLTVVMEVKNAEKLRASLGKVEAAIVRGIAGDQPPPAEGEPQRVPPVAFAQTEHNGAVIRYLKTAGVPNPVAPAWCVTDRYFVISLFPQMTREALMRLDSDGKGSVLENADFTRLMGKLPEGASFVGYSNDRQLVDTFYPAAPPLWQVACSMARSEGFNLAPAWLPMKGSLLRHATGSASVMINRPDGFYSEGRGMMLGSAAGVMLNVMSSAAQMAFINYRTTRMMEIQMEAEMRAVPAEPAVEPNEDF